MFKERIMEVQDCFEKLKGLEEKVETAINWIVSSIKSGGKLLVFGNGGSAADAQHLAGEFVNRFLRDRTPLPAVALTTDTSILTSISNDYSFDLVFRKQVEALGKRNDIAIGISTSGNSLNVIEGIMAARSIGMKTIALTGESGGRVKDVADLTINVPSSFTPRIQEMHLFVYHYIAEKVEEKIFGES